MQIKTDTIIIGSGAGGATVAKELARRGKKTLVIERGQFPRELGTMRSAVFSHYDRCALRTSREGVIIYRTLMVGGTTVVSCGNGVRVLEKELKALGIDLSQEFMETEKELGVNPLPDSHMGPGSRMIMDAANRLGFNMAPMPKYIDFNKCTSCGLCVLGCRTGAKWSALSFVDEAERGGARVLTKLNARSIVANNGKVIGVVAEGPEGKVRIYAKTVVLCAGGIGSPVILKQSGIENAGNKLFADLFNVTYGILRDKDINLWHEPSMSALSTKFKDSHGFIMAPYIDAP
ncbi:MAG: GMC family oxidoreductase N-terminal domain-containing protein, partial [Candidatus Omnitrophota bacterium]